MGSPVLMTGCPAPLFVLVDFPSAIALNVHASEISLVAGYSPGDVIYPGINWDSKGDKSLVKMGSKGIVVAPSDQEGQDLLVKFPDTISLHVMCDSITLDGGYIPGNEIYSKISWTGYTCFHGVFVSIFVASPSIAVDGRL